MCKEGTLSLSAWCKGPQATPPDQCHHASLPDEPHVSTKFQQIFTFPTICPILLNIGIRWGGEDEKHIEVDYIFFRKDASDGVGRFFTRSSLCRVKMLARPQISVFLYISSCLVKEDEDAVRNNLAGDANPVVKEIPEFPPRHPHLHPVHMLRKIFLMKKNASHILPSPSHRLRTVQRSLFCWSLPSSPCLQRSLCVILRKFIGIWSLLVF